jgi:glycosyltransferase involved in cell wall biosynthesis
VTKPHLVFLGHGAERTGPPIMLGHLFTGLAASGTFDLSVITARSGPLLADYEASSTRVFTLGPDREPMRRTAAVLRQVGAAGWVDPVQDLRRHHVARRVARADLVYVNAATPPTADLLRVLNPPPSVPVIVHVHELDIGLRLTLDHERRTALFTRADHVIAASAPVARTLIDSHGLAPADVTTCPEFVDVQRLAPSPGAEVRAELGISDGAHVIGSVGLPDWRKDPDHLLRAVHLMAQAPGPTPHIVWIGGDPHGADGRRMADEARRLGLTDHFHHVAHQVSPDRLLGALDVFALPAREDAFPLAALEAGAVGIPLVCFRTGGVADLCDRGAGTAVDYPDTRAFAAALTTLLRDPIIRARAGNVARTLVSREHDLDVGVRRIAAVIDAQLGRVPR